MSDQQFTEEVQVEEALPIDDLPVDDSPEPEPLASGFHLVTWKGEQYDLRGFTGFRYWQDESRETGGPRLQRAYLTSDGRVDHMAAVPCLDVEECRQFAALCGPYFGETHLGA